MTTTEQPARRKTTIEIDMRLLARAQEVLGTSGIKDTIDKALHEAWRTAMRERFLRRLETQRGVDLGPEILEQARDGWTRWAE